MTCVAQNAYSQEIHFLKDLASFKRTERAGVCSGKSKITKVASAQPVLQVSAHHVAQKERRMSDVETDPSTLEDTTEYAIIEIFGHRRLSGRVIEVEKFGTKLLRIDIPNKGSFENGFTTQFYGGASLFSVTPCDLATVEKANKPYESAGRLTYSEPSETDFEDEDPI